MCVGWLCESALGQSIKKFCESASGQSGTSLLQKRYFYNTTIEQIWVQSAKLAAKVQRAERLAIGSSNYSQSNVDKHAIIQIDVSPSGFTPWFSHSQKRNPRLRYLFPRHPLHFQSSKLLLYLEQKILFRLLRFCRVHRS